MATIHIQATTSVTPDQFLAALTDFGPTRAQIWPNSQPRYLKIHQLERTSADVTEGSNVFGGVWERVIYDWSAPHLIRLSTIDSNLWDKRSGWVYQLTQLADDCTRIQYSITRYPLNLRARLTLSVVALFGRCLIKKDFENSLREIELRYRELS
jgi:hypothetical protein